MKLKTRPSMREKKRYIVFRVRSDGEMDYLNIRGAIWNSMQSWLGDDGLARSGFRIIKNLWDGKAGTGVVRCAPKYVDRVKVALALVHQIGDGRVAIQVLRVSGTIKSALEKSGIKAPRSGQDSVA